jgi:two-component system, NarL family, response regulator NreC
VKILLADDHKIMRDGLRAILEKEDLEVVGEAASGREALAQARRLQPQVVVMDISMPDLNGIDATGKLMAELPNTKVIALSMNSDRRYVLAMFKAGAVGYLLKNAASEELIAAVRAVADDLTYVSPAIASLLVDDALGGKRGGPGQAMRALSQREREVLQLLAEGKSSKDIAARLEVAVPTVETHRRQIMDKLALRTIAELTKYAIREGLTTLD